MHDNMGWYEQFTTSKQTQEIGAKYSACILVALTTQQPFDVAECQNACMKFPMYSAWSQETAHGGEEQVPIFSAEAFQWYRLHLSLLLSCSFLVQYLFLCLGTDYPITQESVILARWLMGVTMAVAEKAPEDEHVQLLDKKC